MKYSYLFLLIVFLASCKSGQRGLDDIKRRQEIRVLTLNTPTTYFENNDGEIAGLEYEMTQMFASELGIGVKYILVDSVEELFEGLEYGRGDLIAAGISVTDIRQSNYAFGPSYQEIEKEIVCRPNIRPKKIEDLRDIQIVVAAGTSYVEELEFLRSQYPYLKWTEVKGMTTFQIFEEIADHQYDCTVADSNIAAVARRPFPSLEIPMKLGGKDQLAWVFMENQSELLERVDQWFKNSLSKSKFNELKEKYYGHTRQFDPFDTKVFKKRVVERLPQFVEYFKEAGQQYDWPWKLLAAISYQESQWDPLARSPTGVRGLMMLTQATAMQMGVEDRLDPEQSIKGGAKYLSHLRGRVPSYIPSEDRLWMTFAAYNVGYQHLRNARAVAVWRDLNPNSWANVREALPLLTQKRYYKYLPNGFARGSEPVIFVDRIRHYYDLIVNLPEY